MPSSDAATSSVMSTPDSNPSPELVLAPSPASVAGPVVSPPAPRVATIKAIGVGGAGANVIEQMIRSGLGGVGFAVVNTDSQSLAGSSAAEKLLLDSKLLHGLGSGGDPERGRQLAEENLGNLKAMCAGVDVVMIVAGLGGGAGTGICPVLARCAKEAGSLVLGFVLTPFECEGGRRQRIAQHGLGELKAAADGVVCLPNQRIFKLIDENTSVLDTFKITNEFLCQGIRGFWRLLTHQGLINIHFDELCAVVRDQHAESAIAAVDARGPGRARELAEKLLTHPMLDGGQMLADAAAVLVSVIGGPDLTMAEIDRVMEQVNRHADRAQILMGAVIDESFRDRMVVTVIATRREGAHPKVESRLSGGGEGPLGEVFTLTTTRAGFRSGSRSSADAARARKGASKLRQGQLALEIVSKGRFDNSEPNIHKGEDLDIPTYVRKGMALN